VPSNLKFSLDDGVLESRASVGGGNDPAFRVCGYESDRVALILQPFRSIATGTAELWIGLPRVGIRYQEIGASQVVRNPHVVTIDDIFDSIKQEVWLTSSDDLDKSAFVTEVICDKCRMNSVNPLRSGLLDYRVLTVASIPALTYVKLINSNSRRVSLSVTISNPDAPVNRVIKLAISDSGLKDFFLTAGGIDLVMPYRDWGPLIKEEIWVNHGFLGLPTATIYEAWQTG